MLATTLATLAVRRTADRALPGKPGTPGKATGRRPNLRHQVEVPRLYRHKGLHSGYFVELEPDLDSGAQPGFLLFRFTVSLPCNEPPARREQRSRVFRDHRQRRERAS